MTTMTNESKETRVWTKPAMTARDWITTAAENDRDALIQGIKILYNCAEVDVDADGDVWIQGPQAGHWVKDDGLSRIARALERGDI